MMNNSQKQNKPKKISQGHRHPSGLIVGAGQNWQQGRKYETLRKVIFSITITLIISISVVMLIAIGWASWYLSQVWNHRVDLADAEEMVTGLLSLMIGSFAIWLPIVGILSFIAMVLHKRTNTPLSIDDNIDEDTPNFDNTTPANQDINYQPQNHQQYPPKSRPPLPGKSDS